MSVPKVDNALLDELTAKAKASPRLRMNLDMRNTPEDSSQRMFNALEPGTAIPIHRHTGSTETVCLLRGAVRLIFFDGGGLKVCESTVEAGSPCPFYLVPRGTWHTIECLRPGTILFESKDGAFEPASPSDVMQGPGQEHNDTIQ